MNWKSDAEKFLKKQQNPLSHHEFCQRALGPAQGDGHTEWELLSGRLDNWNETYLLQYEDMILISPIMWNLELYISSFRVPQPGTDIEDWLYWAFFSAYANCSVLSGLSLRNRKNTASPWKYFLKTQETLGADARQLLKTFHTEYFYGKTHTWIDNEEFLLELGQKRERSYKRLIAHYQRLAAESPDTGETYLSSRLPAYRKYEAYEELFQKHAAVGHTLEIAEINPHGMDDLLDDNMCYLIKAEDIIYILFLEDYA